MVSNYGYLTEAQHCDFGNRNTSNSAEWDRQTSRMEEFIDDAVGPYPKFQFERKLTITSLSSTTFTAPELDQDKDEYYTNRRLTGRQGNGKGDVRRITSYDGTTKIATINTAWTDNPTTTSVVIMDQPSTFPRINDFDSDGRPFILDEVTRATSAGVEFLDVKDGGSGEGVNADVFNTTGGATSESIGNYSVSYEQGQIDVRNRIGDKAYMILENAGLIRVYGTIV